MENRLWLLVAMVLGIGYVVTFAGFFGFVATPLLFLAFFILFFVGSWTFLPIFYRGLTLQGWEKGIFYLLCIVWLLHSIQLFVPETGFDAIWYHLPVIERIIADGKITYIPELYQTMNPLFADVIFMVGYQILGVVGAKIVAYLFAVLLVMFSYVLARKYLNRRRALIVILGVSLLQVVAWQSSSVYVDVAKAMFEIAGLAAVVTSIKKKDYRFLFFASVLFSASLATKMFSLLLVPLFIYAFVEGMLAQRQNNLWIVPLIAGLFSLSLPYYLGAWWYTGNPIFSLVVPLAILGEIGGNGSPIGFLFDRVLTLYRAPLQLFMTRDYVIHLSLLLAVPIVWKIRKILSTAETRILLVFSVYQFGIWWFLPPFSTRYALSGFITLWIVGVFVVERYVLTSSKRRKMWFVVLGLQIFLLFLPRVYVAHRSLKYTFSEQTTAQYLQQFYDGNIDPVLDDWYFCGKKHTEGVLFE
ncbi:MAG: glycosyltransferase family 39 protein [Pseudomonadales bacterium]|nr:glycosyltransferase family 39 protein [Pseudomonadales bacterium]